MKKIVFIFIFALFANLAFAQNEGGNKVMGIENGIIYGYNLGTNNLGSGNFVALNLSVSKKVQTSFIYINGDAINLNNFNLLGVSYLFSNKLGLNISVGQDTTAGLPVAGTGIYYSIFEKVFDNTINTDFQFKLDYLYDFTNGIESGTLTFSLSGSIGI